MENHEQSQDVGALAGEESLDTVFPADEDLRPSASERAGEVLQEFETADAGDPVPPRERGKPGRPRVRSKKKQKRRYTKRRDAEPSAEPPAPDSSPIDELDEQPARAPFDPDRIRGRAKMYGKLGKLIYRLWGKDKVLSDAEAEEWGESLAECLAEMGNGSDKVAKVVESFDKMMAPGIFVGVNVDLVETRIERDRVARAEAAEVIGDVRTIRATSSAK
jgi:hypothetical protein